MGSLCFEVSEEVLRNSNAIVSLIQCFVYHILYMRGLIPAPFKNIQADVFDQELEESGTKHTSAQKKTKAFVLQTTGMMQGIQALMQVCSPLTFVLIFGPSATNMKETYSLEFCGHGDLMPDSSTMAPRALDRLQRQLLMKLVDDTSQVDYRPIAQTNIFCSLKVKRSPDITDAIEKGLSDVSFVLRENWKIKSNKRGPAPLNVKILTPLPQHSNVVDSTLEYECCSSVAELTLDDLSGEENGAVEKNPALQECWLVLKKGIKSLRASI